MPGDVANEFAKLGPRVDLGRYGPTFTGVDREAETTIAHAEFRGRAAERKA